MAKEVKLISGRLLKIDLPEFAVSKALYKAICEEGVTLNLDLKNEMEDFMKDVFCTMISSDKIEKCIQDCFKRVIYNGNKIVDDTFETLEAREDYYDICYEVAKENIMPFTKSLSVQLKRVMALVQSSQT